MTRAGVLRLMGMAALTVAALSPLALPVSAANAATAGDSSLAATRPDAAMILLDTDLSVARKRVPAERAAARAYLAALPAGVRAGLITFAGKWQLVVPPTTDRRLLGTALAAIRAYGGKSTGLPAALSAAESLLSPGKAPGSRLLVLSDAENLTNGPLQATIPVDVVTWRYDPDDNTRVLQSLALASGGHVAGPAQAAGLARAFAAAAARPAVPAGSAARGPGWLLTAILACVFTALLVLVLLIGGALGGGGRGPSLVSRIERYGPRRAHAPAAAEGGLATAALGWADRLLQSSNTERGLAERLDRAGIARSPADWVLLCGCAWLALAATLTLLTGDALVGIPIGVLTGWLVMRLTVSLRTGRRRAAFGEQLPDVLQLIAGSLQSGFSLPQALDTVVREDTQPAAGEFSRALAEARIGADLEDALSRVAERMDSIDLRWTVMAIRIQRDVGGNLAEVLRTTVGTMRERAYIRRQVRALSAEGRLSGYIVVGLPVLVGAWFFYSSPAYMRPLYTTPVGVLMLGGAVAGVVLGALWMRKIINVEV